MTVYPRLIAKQLTTALWPLANFRFSYETDSFMLAGEPAALP